MSVFVDTSALLPVLDSTDADHARTAARWVALLRADEHLVTTSYVLAESYSLVQARLGMGVLRRFASDVAPTIQVVWVDERIHAAASESVLAADERRLSLVDCASFAVMRERGMRRAFALDRHFRERGFELVV